MKDISLEGDKYYERNKEAQTLEDIFQEYLRSLPLAGMRVLDIGCLAGYRLEDLRQRGAVCFGIDASPQAIADGKKLYPEIELVVGAAHALPYADSQFDVVYVNFVFYTIPREFLSRTVSEIDRVLKNGGRLIIADFFPDAPHRRPDAHAQGEFTYKQQYRELFTASNLYKERRRLTYAFKSSTKDDSLRGGDNDSILVDLEKNLENNYPVRKG